MTEMFWTYVLLIYIQTNSGMKITAADIHLEEQECLQMAKEINDGNNGNEIAACMPMLKEGSTYEN
tara:strand:- start:277 stop:474 length:198 start_codon:yes stop_codon:yes gene_type:complete